MSARELITETLVLPSAATRLYGENFDGQLTLRAMTTMEERMRLSGQSFYKIMSKIINECIVDNKNPDGTYKIDSASFTDFDFFATCVKLRMISYGVKYKTIAICPTCGHKFEYVADLSKLAYNLVPEDFHEPYDVGPLPSSGDTLGCRFLRAKDHIDIEKTVEYIKSKYPDYIGDPAYELEMQKRIVTVNGTEIDYINVEDYVRNMISMDTVVYHDKIDKEVYGVVRLNVCDCENPQGCGGHAVWILKADREFFRPCLDN
jgi:hypothetical protein